MNALVAAVRDWGWQWVQGWDRFWFTPRHPATLSLIRILAGSMLFYTHLVWTLGLEDFFGPNAWIRPDAVRNLPPRTGAWSYFFIIESPTLLWTVHLAALVIFAMLALGLFTRVVAVLAFLCAVSYANRVPGALFGLDDTEVMLAMYLMLGPSGAIWSLDRWLARRRAVGLGRTGEPDPLPAVVPSVSTNIAIRLIQLHMCLMYLFAGMGKLLGPGWWNGTALWGAVANLEYQSIDLTWLRNYPYYPYVVNLLTHITIFWEVFYCALVWPRLTRPIVLGLAVMVHLGIGTCMGLMTFGLIMIVGNLAFVEVGEIGIRGQGLGARESI